MRPPRRRHAVVTGAAGYLGRELCAQLLADNWRVTAIVRQATSGQFLESEGRIEG